ncbi:hypothetical protein SAMN05444851_1273 [Aliiroseovarius sediminilitoris]|uniref:CENP-V/GFA domain-containing protein n=1 Tax=Aliiroseovarius sediminilitoris TaxID=1173584 RepID=A0A1I0P1N3_9RHOB|nr:DUF6151 family protein [Aliiroseovarius sediminilitoris]SEW07965.1 hypothetical protein SAMN05444851_1273 [Aliiroseovarius sediminilitoris]
MKIQCDCGSFQAELANSPKNSPGRLVCYCDDCQAFAEMLERTDVLDEFGGTEVVPAYPSDITFIKGESNLCYSQVTQNGLYRFSTTCCNSPIVNTRPNFPWAGIFHSAYTAADTQALKKFGEIRGRIRGTYAKGNPDFKVSDKIGARDMLTVLPFVVKGKLFGKHKGSPFFENDGATPIGLKRP